MTDIGKNIRSGVFFTALSRYSNVAASIFVGAILARLLTPKEFGTVAIVVVFLSFFNLLSSFGIGAAVIQNKTLTDEDNSSIFSFSILFGVVLSIIFFFGAPLIASFYDEPVLKSLSQLMSLNILLNSLQIVPYALTAKKLKFKEIGIISVIVYIISGTVAIVLAYLGFSYYALVINSIVSALLLFLSYLYLSPVKPSLIIRFNSIKKIIKFSSFQFLFQFINYFAGNTDNLLIGKFFNAAALGFYDKAYKLMLMPVQNLTFVITPVLHPVLAKYQDDKKIIYDAYHKVVKLLAIIGFPLSFFLFFSASEIINIVYGPQWGQSIPVFKLLALAVGIQIVLSSTGSIFQATNRTDLLFYSGLLSTILVLSGILYGVFIGKNLLAVGYGILIAFSINVFQAFYLLIKISLKHSFFKFLHVFLFPMLLATGVAISLWLISQFNFYSTVISFVIKCLVTLLIFGIILFSSKENLRFVKEYFKKMIKR